MQLLDFDAELASKWSGFKYSLFLRLFSCLSLSRPATIPQKSKLSPSPFPAGKARDAQGEH
ncbi:MAG: hypothetical protein P4K93_17325, partial [Terracidiphilus sp.]|nr:hypothetical protein [Terracidiphilus sp.]